MKEDLAIVGTLLSALIGGGGWLIRHIFAENNKLVKNFIDIQRETVECQRETINAIDNFKSSMDNVGSTYRELLQVLKDMTVVLEVNTDAINLLAKKQAEINPKDSLSANNNKVGKIKKKVAEQVEDSAV